MNEKYIFTGKTKNVGGVELKQIKAIKSFLDIVKGEVGGWIEGEFNLNASGDAWISGNAWVYGNAWVSDDARVSGNAGVSGGARVSGDARVYGNKHIVWLSNIGSRFDTTTFYKCENGFKVSCGCFLGTIDEFEIAVKHTHAGTKFEKEYNLAIQLAKTHFDI